MGIINVLDKHVAELIAAGEVVERPASAVKELVENSIDAGSKNVTVEIMNGGTTFIRVTDDGCGIMKEDVKLAFLPHATSKIKIENDLDSISTLGFRGEALSSISSVSKLQLITRHKNEDIGTNFEIYGGEEISFSDAGCPVGTTFIIRDLFYNIPARMKFLKKDVSEGNAVANVIDKIALSHPEVAFTFIRDGKQTLKTSGDGKLKSAIYAVYGRDFANELLPVDYELDGVKVQGYVSKPINARPNRNMQNFFINGRYVKSRTAMAAVEEAGKGSVMVGKFLSCVLHISLSFGAIDVNVHPSKIEVRFINEKPIFNAVYHSVKNSLSNNDQRKNVTFNNIKNAIPVVDKVKINPFTINQAVINEKKLEKKIVLDPIKQLDFVSEIKTNVNSLDDSFNPYNISSNKIAECSKDEDICKYDEVKVETNKVVESISKPVDSTSFVSFKENMTTDYDVTVDVVNSEDNDSINDSQENNIIDDLIDNNQVIKPLIEEEKNTLRLIGEAFNTYIIVEKNNKEIVIIDKHAAHERMIYEKLKKDRGAGFSQLLLQPITVTLDKKDYDNVINNIDMFTECAFDVEDFGNGTIIVRSAPQYLNIEDIEPSVIEMASYITQNKTDIRSEKMDWIYHNVACRAAIKGGNISTNEELIDIANKLDKDPTLRYCPHGRPVCVVMSKYELEKQFGRV